MLFLTPIMQVIMKLFFYAFNILCCERINICNEVIPAAYSNFAQDIGSITYLVVEENTDEPMYKEAENEVHSACYKNPQDNTENEIKHENGFQMFDYE